MATAPRYGVISREEMASLSGIEMLQALIDGRLPGPPIAEGMDFRLVEIGQGMARFEGVPGTRHLNPLGGVHGGWALTLIDSAAGCALHTILPAGTGYTTVETKANFTRPLKPGETYSCEGRLLSSGTQIATAEAYLTGPDGKLAAHGTSTLIILRPR